MQIYTIAWCMSLYLDTWHCETDVNTSNSLGQSIRQLVFDHKTINPCFFWYTSDVVSPWFRKLPNFESLRLIAAELMMASCLRMAYGWNGISHFFPPFTWWQVASHGNVKGVFWHMDWGLESTGSFAKTKDTVRVFGHSIDRYRYRDEVFFLWSGTHPQRFRTF